MYVQQLLVLALEAAVMATIILGLFRARTKFGSTPLYIVLGGFQFLEAMLSLKVPVAPGVVINPASTILFTTTLVTVLLIYVKDDAIEARKLVYGLVLANGAVAIVSYIIGLQIGLPGSQYHSLTSGDFFIASEISVFGTALLFLDVLGIILCYEFVSKFASSLFWRFFLSMLVMVGFDNFFFTLFIHLRYGKGDADLSHVVLVGFLGKAAAALFYSTVSVAYLRFAERRTAVVGTGDVADVFQALTYRQKYEQARERMVRDALTGLFNRGYFDETLPKALAHARRYGEPLSLLVIDTDNFKSINDQFSHMEGDRVLRLIADTITEHARSADVPCRFGGDEFVVLLRADTRDAAAFAERFRTAIQERCLNATPPFPWGHVTTTIGIATYPTDAEVLTADDLIRVADRRLYAGKNAGRDRVVTLAERAHLIGGFK
jgi:diguanylate cyclase (GGDEF)-like protein